MMAGDERGVPDLIPRPDPSLMTSAAVNEAKNELRRELAALREILEARMDSADADRRLVLQIMDERREEIRRRFAERDIRFDERDQARQEAVRTALDAAKELSDARDAAADKAIAKFETSVREQIAQLGELGESGRAQLSTQIQGLKERLDRSEGGRTGAGEYRTESRLNVNLVITAVIAVVAILSLLVLYAAKK
jgi:hypothetical protein